MGDWFSNVADWAAEQASRAATAAGNTANWIGDGVTHPGDALNTAWQQINNIPSWYEAQNHGFSSVEAYQAYLAKQAAASGQPQTYYGTGNQAIDNVLNTVGGIGVNVGAGLGGGTPTGVSAGFGMSNGSTVVPHTAQQVTDAFRDLQIKAASSVNDPQILAQLNKAANDYKTAMGPANVNFQMPNIPGLTYSNSLGYTPINLQSSTNWNNADGTAGQLKLVDFIDESGNRAQHWVPVNTPDVNLGTTPINPIVNQAEYRPGDHRDNPLTGARQTYGTDGVWRDGNSAGPALVDVPPPAAVSGPSVLGSQGVSTATQKPLMTPEHWTALKAGYDQRYATDLTGYTPMQHQADIDALGPQPSANPTNPAIPAAPTQTATPTVTAPPPGTPGVSTAPTGQPNPAGAAAGAAAGLGGVGDAVSWIIKNLGLDANTAAILAAGGASSVASWMAADEQANGATNAANVQSAAYNDALKQLGNQIHDTNTVNTNNYTDQQAHLQPYLTSGTNALNDYNTAVSGYDPNKALSGDPSTWQDPGYQFRLDEGIKALQNSAAAKGGLLSGNTMRGITDYAQGAASQEYKNAYDRYNTTFGTKMNALQPLVNSGQQAVSQYIGAGNNYASNTQQAAQQNQSQYANLTTGQGNALAQGILGASNAKASGYAAGNTIAQGMLEQYSKLKSGDAANNLAAALSSLTKPKVN